MSFLRLPLPSLGGSRAARFPPPIAPDSGDRSPPIVCRMVFDELCVLANGDVVCSCGDPAGLRVYGNVHRDRIADVYDGRMYREVRAWQLASRRDSHCPVLGTACAGRVSRATPLDGPSGRRVRVLQLEPISHCNLRCPSCPATVMGEDPSYARDRRTVLPLATMLDVLEQLPHLEKLLFYNFGEPFLHPDAVPFLREARRRRPDVVIHTSTNGVFFRPGALEALGREALVDRCVFSIDGARRESYARYRVRGDLERALANLRRLVELRSRSGRAEMEIHWQYILFEWNDSDEEIAEACALASEIGVPLKWVVTHTAGASRRFSYGSRALAELTGERHAYDALTCDMRLKELWDAAVPKQRARLSAAARSLDGPPDAVRFFELDVANIGSAPWNAQPASHRIGVRLLGPSGRVLRELPGRPLPPLAPGETHRAFIDARLPDEPGRCALLIDVVEEGVCWLSERGSPPLVIQIEVKPAPRERTWDPEPFVAETFRALTGSASDVEGISWWTERLRTDVVVDVFLAEVTATCGLAPPRAALLYRLAPFARPSFVFPGGGATPPPPVS